MIYIISSKYIAETGKISYSYMFDAEGCNIDKIMTLPYGYFWKKDERYNLNLFKNDLIFGAGVSIRDLRQLIIDEPIPDCSILMTNENAELFTELLTNEGIEFEWFKHSGDYLRTSQ